MSKAEEEYIAPEPKTAPVPPVPERREETGFNISNLDELRRLMVVAQGGDPDAQQTINEFCEFKNPIERSNLPTRDDVQAIAFLDLAGRFFWPDDPDNPFTKAAESISTAFMAKGGWKSQGFVDLMRTTPNLADFQQGSAPQQPGIMDRIRGRPMGGEE